MSIEIEPLLQEILSDYALPWYDIHGLSHWGRVLENGLRLAESTGANTKVVTLFALFHDSRRVNEGHDPGHGQRGAEFARTLRGSLFELTDAEFHMLYRACELHTNGLIDAHETIQTCWDADRLDLGRVGITPWPNRLCTDAARDPAMLEWANQRAIEEKVAESIRDLWGSLSRRVR